jgi:predicted TIM-barrel fold metal-dependent hydrolase
MLKKHKNLKFIGHSQPFWSHISKDLDPKNIEIGEDGKVIPGRITELMREYENLYCDISAGSGKGAITRDREHSLSFFTEFSDRIFFGTDFCPSVIDINTRPMIAFIDDLVESGEIEESVYKKICRENAINILKI